jgi:transposase
LIDEQIGQLDQEMANLLSQHQDAVRRLAEVPGLGVHSAQQIIAEVGATAATFPSEKQLSSWVGACPGDDESAGVNYSHRSPKANRHMRRILNQTANALPTRTRLHGMQSCATKKERSPHFPKDVGQSRARTDFRKEQERTCGSNRGTRNGARSHQYSLATRRRTRQ